MARDVSPDYLTSASIFLFILLLSLIFLTHHLSNTHTHTQQNPGVGSWRQEQREARVYRMEVTDKIKDELF